MRLTTRLILLALIAVIPAILIQTYSLFEILRSREAEVRDEALRQAQLVSSEIDRVLEGIRNLLTAVSTANAVRRLDTATCSPFLARLEAKVPHLDSICRDGHRGQPALRLGLDGSWPHILRQELFPERDRGA